jgi:hypothetical protein
MSSPAATESKSGDVTSVAATTGEAAPRWRKRLSGDFAKALALVVAWQIVLTVVAVFFGPTLAHHEGIPKDGVVPRSACSPTPIAGMH